MLRGQLTSFYNTDWPEISLFWCSKTQQFGNNMNIMNTEAKFVINTIPGDSWLWSCYDTHHMWLYWELNILPDTDTASNSFNSLV